MTKPQKPGTMPKGSPISSPASGPISSIDEPIELFDISPEISPQIAVWPGDQKFQREVTVDFKKGDQLVLSRIQSTLHLGAHTDAPNHYHAEGEGIDRRSLDFYFGDCQVIAVSLPRGERIRVEHLENEKVLAKRVLFKTGSFPDPQNWNSDFNSLSPEVVRYLAELGVILIGIDTPSVDPEKDPKLESHQEIYKNDLAVLEGIVLKDVPTGLFTLIALPLKIRDADASPVRAILIRPKTEH